MKADAIRDRLHVGETRCYQVLGALIETEAPLAHDPVAVGGPGGSAPPGAGGDLPAGAERIELVRPRPLRSAESAQRPPSPGGRGSDRVSMWHGLVARGPRQVSPCRS